MKSKRTILSSILLGIGLSFLSAEGADEGPSRYGKTPHQKQKHGRLIHEYSLKKPAPEKPEPTEEQATNKATINDFLVTLTKEVPEAASVGETIDWQYRVTAKHQDLAEVVVVDTIAPGMKYTSSTPEAQKNGDSLTWKFPLKSRETKVLKAKIKLTETGELSSCVTLTALPQDCAATIVGAPKLIITKKGPETTTLGESVSFNIVVKNEGTSDARNVVITDTVPKGLEHADSQNTLKYNVGNLAPGDSKSLDIPLITKARGRHCNAATVEADNATPVHDEACVTVNDPQLKLVKTGPKQAFILKTATYAIQIQNTGDVDLTQVTIRDKIATPMQLITAQGAKVEANTATWTLDKLTAGSQKEFSIKVKNAAKGNFCNTASAAASNYNVSSSATTCTEWEGVPALLLEVIDTEDPLTIGDKTTYKIAVTNQGSAPDKNIRVTVKIPPEFKLLPSKGAAPLADESTTTNVIFKPYSVLNPGQKIEYEIVTQGIKKGDARLEVQLSSDFLKKPVPEVESTQVY